MGREWLVCHSKTDWEKLFEQVMEQSPAGNKKLDHVGIWARVFGQKEKQKQQPWAGVRVMCMRTTRRPVVKWKKKEAGGMGWDLRGYKRLDHGLIYIFREFLEVRGKQWLDFGCISMLKPVSFGGPVAKTLHSQMQGAQVRSLVRELHPAIKRSHSCNYDPVQPNK